MPGKENEALGFCEKGLRGGRRKEGREGGRRRRRRREERGGVTRGFGNGAGAEVVGGCGDEEREDEYCSAYRANDAYTRYSVSA